MSEVIVEKRDAGDGTKDGATTVQFIAAAGSPGDNERQLVQKAEQAITALETADATWGALTAAQKDQAMRLAVRGVAKLARLMLRRLEAN